jgi:sugar/nucleoside kinase (ribokinase family)
VRIDELADHLGAGTDARGFALDVVGVGALNLDYIVKASASVASPQSLTSRIFELVTQTGTPPERGTERRVDDGTIHAVIEAASWASPDTSLGGSAFNTIHAIASTQVGLRLGYVGVAGRVPVTGVSSIRLLETLGIDHTWVLRDSEHLCGICFSLCHEGDRTLFTTDGANEYMADYLDRHFNDIVAYLAGARVVHVTSFIDLSPAEPLLAVLRAVRTANRDTLICFDPGHSWSVDPTPAVNEIVRISDFLLVNYREFGELCGRRAADSDREVAGRLLRRFDSDQSMIIVKHATGIWSYWRQRDDVMSDFYPQVPLPADEVEDATGAGDVFAAGLLIVLTRDRLRVKQGSLLGMRLARHKLRHVGSAGHAQFSAIAADFFNKLGNNE